MARSTGAAPLVGAVAEQLAEPPVDAAALVDGAAPAEVRVCLLDQ